MVGWIFLSQHAANKLCNTLMETRLLLNCLFLTTGTDVKQSLVRLRLLLIFWLSHLIRLVRNVRNVPITSPTLGGKLSLFSTQRTKTYTWLRFKFQPHYLGVYNQSSLIPTKVLKFRSWSDLRAHKLLFNRGGAKTITVV